MDKELQKNIKEVWNNFFKEYEELGLLSVYVYGSALNPKDYKPDSDIDMIGIVKNDFNEKYELEIREKLVSFNEEYRLDLRFCILFLDELDGEKNRSFLNTVLSAKVLIRNFNNWFLVCGRKFSLEDFKMKPATIQESIEFYYNLTKKEKEIIRYDNSKLMYLVKDLIYYFYYKSIEENYFDFSYSDLIDKIDIKYKTYVQLLINVKNNNYNTKFTNEILNISEEI